jgi:hypothetical protein
MAVPLGLGPRPFALTVRRNANFARVQLKLNVTHKSGGPARIQTVISGFEDQSLVHLDDKSETGRP